MEMQKLQKMTIRGNRWVWKFPWFIMVYSKTKLSTKNIDFPALSLLPDKRLQWKKKIIPMDWIFVPNKNRRID